MIKDQNLPLFGHNYDKNKYVKKPVHSICHQLPTVSECFC